MVNRSAARRRRTSTAPTPVVGKQRGFLVQVPRWSVAAVGDAAASRLPHTRLSCSTALGSLLDFLRKSSSALGPCPNCCPCWSGCWDGVPL
jgi:hypothetical protein